MGMASVSRFYLFNIQVRANCTTACNIQAALQYVELTHVSSSVSFFSVSVAFLQKCACSLEQVPKSCWPRPFLGGRGLQAEQRMSIGGWSAWLVTFHIHRDAQGKLWAILLFCSLVCFSGQSIEPNQWRDCFFFFLFFLFFLLFKYTFIFFFEKLNFLL